MPKKNIEFVLFVLLTVFGLEGVADTIEVTNTSNAGVGSLRQAITEANEHVGADTIVFNIPQSDDGYNNATGVWTIQPTEVLPYLTDPGTCIHGGSQTSSVGDTNALGPEIEIDGVSTVNFGITSLTSHTIIQGLVINRFSSTGIMLDGADSNTIQGNYIGTDVTGEIALPNYTGIGLYAGAQQNLIGGNNANVRNVISGNAGYGILLSDTGTDDNRIRGNYIGTNAAGDDTVGNRYSGIRITGGPSGNRIGGTNPIQKNIIAGTSFPGNVYSGNGITITNSNGNIILGNYIGTDLTGSVALPNIDYGIMIKECESTVVGGTTEGRCNVISGNGQAGIFIRSNTATLNTIAGNMIGTDASGELPLGNMFDGIVLDYGAHDNMIGPGNIIAHNGRYGVRSEHDSTRANTVTRNSIFDHYYSGIGNNDGSNDSIQAPVLLDVSEFEMSGMSCPGCVIEIFSDEEDEGAVFEGSTTANEIGEFMWTGMAAGPVITATATDSAGNTSEFSAPYSLAVENLGDRTSPNQLALSSYPNPFCAFTKLSFFIPTNGHVHMVITDLNGREIATVVDRHCLKGGHNIVWDGSLSTGFRAPSGVYMYTLTFSGRIITRRTVLLRP